MSGHLPPAAPGGIGSNVLLPPRLHWTEVAWWLLAIGVFFAFPEYRPLGAAAFIMVIFVIAYDLVLGYAGIASMGQGMYFGIGAYAAALMSLAGWTEVISGAIAAGLLCAVLAGMVGPFLLRLAGLPLIMVTIGLSVIVLEIANKLPWTGGDDGLGGLEFAPLFGVFEWTLYGETKYLYALGWTFVAWLVVRAITRSGFGMALRGIQANRTRMLMLGDPVLPRLVMAYVVSAALAGVAGAVLTQTTKFAGLRGLSLDVTFDGIVMTVLGGVGTLIGGMYGAVLYLVFKHFAQQWNPHYWMLVVGLFLILIVRFSKGGIFGLLQRIRLPERRRARP